MSHIPPEKVANFDFTKDGQPLEYVWEAHPADGWVDIIATDRQGNLIPSPNPEAGCPYDLIRVRGTIAATPTTKKIGEPIQEEYRDPCQSPDYCQPQEYENRYGCDFPPCCGMILLPMRKERCVGLDKTLDRIQKFRENLSLIKPQT